MLIDTKNISYCTLSGEVFIATIDTILRKHDQIAFDENGNVAGCIPYSKIKIQGFVCKKEIDVLFYENGNVKEFISGKKQEINGIVYGVGIRIYLDENGEVLEIENGIHNETTI